MVIFQFNFTLMVYIILVQKVHRQPTGKISSCFPEKQTKINRQTKNHILQLGIRGLFYREQRCSWAVFQSGWKCTLLWKPPHCVFNLSSCDNCSPRSPRQKVSHRTIRDIRCCSKLMYVLGEWRPGHEWVKMIAWTIVRVSLMLSPI